MRVNVVHEGDANGIQPKGYDDGAVAVDCIAAAAAPAAELLVDSSRLATRNLSVKPPPSTLS
jgi:hypothetical protein